MAGVRHRLSHAFPSSSLRPPEEVGAVFPFYKPTLRGVE